MKFSDFFSGQRTSEPAAVRVARAFSAGRMERQKVNVLMVEDDPYCRSVFAAVAEKEFLNVNLIQASSCAEARKVIATTMLDAAILDVRLTNGDGVRIYAEVSETHPEMEVVFVTGFLDETLIKKVEAIGPARVYSKQCLNLRFVDRLLAQFGGVRPTTPPPIPSPLPA